jgi:hypothetical protein
MEQQKRKEVMGEDKGGMREEIRTEVTHFDFLCFLPLITFSFLFLKKQKNPPKGVAGSFTLVTSE